MAPLVIDEGLESFRAVELIVSFSIEECDGRNADRHRLDIS